MSQETVRQAWRDKIWTHSQVRALTEKVLEHDLSEDSHKEISQTRHNQKINFFGFRVRRRIQTLLNRKLRYYYVVDISYTRWADPDGTNYNAVLDGIELVVDLVRSELGSTWNGQVEDSVPQATVPNITVVSLGEEKVYRAEFTFEGIIGAVD